MKLTSPLGTTRQTGDEHSHWLIRRAGLHLVVTRLIALAFLANEGSTSVGVNTDRSLNFRPLHLVEIGAAGHCAILQRGFTFLLQLVCR